MKTIFTDAYIKSIKQPRRYTDAATTDLNFNVKNNSSGCWMYGYLFGGKLPPRSSSSLCGLRLHKAGAIMRTA